jgi:two-component system sensor histidine kinase/response regulator
MSAVTAARGTAGSVMVVDDNPANLKLMGDMLGMQGYEVRLFPRGRMALASAAQKPPELVLLDINMPEMDGYEVCRRLKADASLAQIPVIFLSALHDTQDKVKGLQCGGVDYIAKPFQVEEVQARVETHLKVYTLQRALQFQNEHLERTVACRTRELQEAHTRLKILDTAKDDFLKLISHEFRTPLNGLLGAGELLLGKLPQTEATQELVEMFEISRKRILSMLDDALLLTQIDVAGERFAPLPVSLRSVLDRALGMSAGAACEAGVALNAATQHDCAVLGDERLLATALHEMIEAGLQFASPGSTIQVKQEETARVSIDIAGRTIPERLIEKFFDVFAMHEASIAGVVLGLGPALAYRILSLFGGGASVENRGAAGIRLTALLRETPPAG